MLPHLNNDGKFLIPSWVYLVLGLFIVIFTGIQYPDPGIRTMAVGLNFLMMHTGIEVAANRYRIDRLEGENQALHRLLETGDHTVGR